MQSSTTIRHKNFKTGHCKYNLVEKIRLTKLYCRGGIAGILNDIPALVALAEEVDRQTFDPLSAEKYVTSFYLKAHLLIDSIQLHY